MFLLTILMHFLLWHIFKVHIKFKAYSDNIFCMTLRSVLGSSMVYCVQMGKRGGEEEKGWGYTPLFGFFFFPVGVNYKC